MAEKFAFQSPYVYAANNPVRFIDWMGMSPRNPDEKDYEAASDYGVRQKGTAGDRPYSKYVPSVSVQVSASYHPPEDNFGGGSRGIRAEVNDELVGGEFSEKGEEVVESGGSIETIGTILGFALSSTEQVMKLILVTELELRQAFLDKGYSTERIDRIISRTGTTGGIARVGGQILFWGQAGYNFHNMLMVDRSFENIALRSSDTFFSGLATYGGWPGIGIAGVYYLGKESIIITINSLDQGLIKPNTNIGFSPGLAPSPVIWNWE